MRPELLLCVIGESRTRGIVEHVADRRSDDGGPNRLDRHRERVESVLDANLLQQIFQLLVRQPLFDPDSLEEFRKFLSGGQRLDSQPSTSTVTD